MIPYPWVIIGLLFFLVIWLLVVNDSTIKENYGVVSGTLAKYVPEMSECARRCNLQDPRSRLYGGTNIGCNDYCENLFIKKEKEKVEPKALAPEFVSTIEKCNMRCGVDTETLRDYNASTIPPPFALRPDNNIMLPIDNPDYIRSNVWRGQQKRCVDDCVGKYNIAEWCKTMMCPYTTLNEGECMEQCIAMRSVDNVSGGWNFDLNFRG